VSPRRTADEIAALFVRYDEPTGSRRLTAKQAAWLETVAREEARAARRASDRSAPAGHATGRLPCPEGATCTWELVRYPGGAGVLRVTYLSAAWHANQAALGAYTARLAELNARVLELMAQGAGEAAIKAVLAEVPRPPTPVAEVG
jgi:hypothetical protein